MRSILLLLIALALTSCAFRQVHNQDEGPLELKITSLLNDPKLQGATVAVRIETLDGEILFDHNGNLNLTPASNLKIMTTAAAVDLLGEDYRYNTKVMHTGSIDNGVLNGDLVIIGSGDPSLGAWHPDKNHNAQKVFDGWITALRTKGIQRINGRIIGDGTIFHKEYIHPDWVYWDLPYWYAAGSSGLAIEENCFRTQIIAGEQVGDPAIITINPETDYVTFENYVVTVSEDGENNADIVWRNEENHFRYDRTVHIGKTINERGSIWDGAKYTAFLFKERLEREGISVSGSALNVRELDNFTEQMNPISNTLSPPIKEQIEVVNQVSHNFFADMHLRTIGVKAGGDGSWDSGTNAIQKWLKETGAPEPDAFKMEDGSGLSASNILQAQQLTYILRRMRSHQPFYNSLSNSDEGWLANRYDNYDLDGKIKAKTGYIELVRSLSGYLQTEGDNEYVFAMISNNHNCRSSEVDAIFDQILEYVSKNY